MASPSPITLRDSSASILPEAIGVAVSDLEHWIADRGRDPSRKILRRVLKDSSAGDA